MSDYLPPEVVVQILFKLPIKSLIKFTTVHKPWKSLIETSDFTHTHLTRQNTHNSSLLLFKVIDRVQDHCLLYNPETGDSTRLDYPPLPAHLLAQQVNPLRSEPRFNVHATCNGLAYLSWPYPYWAAIWNPSIRKYVRLPSPRFVSTPAGCSFTALFKAFGYDMRTKDYKVLNIFRDYGIHFTNLSLDVSYDVEVYSLARGSWRRLGADVVPKGNVDFENCVFLNGYFHWFQYGRGRGNCIVTFDIHGEVFDEMVVCDAIAGLSGGITRVSRYGESLAVVDMVATEEGSKFTVWVRSSVAGAEELWNVLFSLCLDQLPHSADFVPRASRLMLNMFEFGVFYAECNEAIMVDIEWGSVFVGYFVDSLVLLGHANAISY